MEEMQKTFEKLNAKLTSPSVLAFLDFDVAFLVLTDVPATAVGAALAQEKYVCIHPIQFAGQTMITAENNYSAYEWEVLVFIFARMKFWVYI